MFIHIVLHFIGLTVGVSLLLFVSYLFMAYIIYKPWKGPSRSPPRSPVLWQWAWTFILYSRFIILIVFLCLIQFQPLVLYLLCVFVSISMHNKNFFKNMYMCFKEPLNSNKQRPYWRLLETLLNPAYPSRFERKKYKRSTKIVYI